MVLMPKNFRDAQLLQAKYYFQERVPNFERVVQDVDQLLRLLLYDYYPQKVHSGETNKKEDEITKRLPQQSYEE